MKIKVHLNSFASFLGFVVIFFGSLGFLSSFFSKGLFCNDLDLVMSPFTYFSLVLMMTAKMAERYIETWSKLFTLAILGVVACGNFSSLWIQLTFPELFMHSMPSVVPTSAMTSIGLIVLCFYDILVSVRKIPESAFIFDDILLHLALFPGGLSLLGHILDVKAYMGIGLDPRVGVSPIEMFFMGSYVLVAFMTNPNFFLWEFLSRSHLKKLIFLALFLNQYVAPVIVGLNLRDTTMLTSFFGIEFYVMLSGVLTTLVFLTATSLYLRGVQGK